MAEATDPDEPFVDVDDQWSIERIRWLLDDLRARPQRLLIALIVVAVLGGGGWFLVQAAAPPVRVEDALPVATPLPASALPPTPAQEVVVHAAGAVVRPGVYRMPQGSRVGDVLDVAQGTLPNADLRQVNLAAVVADGARIYIPEEGESAPAVLVDGAAGGSVGEAAAEAPISVNAAPADRLEDLPGVGPATAGAIVAYREDNGPFASLEELLDVSGIGPAKLEQIRTRATL